MGESCLNHYTIESPTQSCNTCNTYYHKVGSVCEPNVCICTNGSKTDNNCEDDEDYKCQSCDNGYELIGIAGQEGTECTPIKCTCHHGAGVTNGGCNDSADHRCQLDGCNNGYVFDSDDEQCKPTCNCINGIDIFYTQCSSLGANECGSCNYGYGLDGLKCEKNICTCNNGRTAPDDLCHSNYLENCSECELGYEISEYGEHNQYECFERGGCSCQYGDVAETCADSQHECQENSCQNVAKQTPLAHGYFFNGKYLEHTIYKCIPKECNCDNGTPKATGTCTDEDTQQCDSCFDNYDQQGTTCVGYICKCDHGEISGPGDCKATDNHQCSSCHNFYHQDEAHSECVENVCQCHLGTPVPNAQCVTHGEQQCASCDDHGYMLDDNDRCVPRVCPCNHGSGVSDGTCLSDKVERCSKYDSGYALSLVDTQFMKEYYSFDGRSDSNTPSPIVDFFQELCIELTCVDLPHMKLDSTGNACENKICSCSHGIPLIGEDCTDEEQEMCQNNGCFDGYKIEGSECISENLCTCQNGNPATGSNCETNNAAKCESCYPGFELVDDVCDTIVCQCANGQAVSDGTCYDANWNHCHSCNENFHLVHNNQQAYFHENDGFHFVSSCEADVICQCDFGQAVTGDACPNNNDHICEFCYSPGYSLDENQH